MLINKRPYISYLNGVEIEFWKEKKFISVNSVTEYDSRPIKAK